MLRKLLILLCTLTLLNGCANMGKDPRDPFEGLNRSIYTFNDSVDRVILKPVATGYRAITPEPLDKGISNAFGNLQDITTAINGALQLKISQSGADTARVLINSTVGLLGFFDVASHIGLTKHREDFNQVLKHWGVGAGPYLVLPFFGPSSLRHLAGRSFDVSIFNPINQIDHQPPRTTLQIVKVIDQRADLLNASNIVSKAALDPYNFVKETYFQQQAPAAKDDDAFDFPDFPDFPE